MDKSLKENERLCIALGGINQGTERQKAAVFPRWRCSITVHKNAFDFICVHSRSLADNTPLTLF